MNDQKSLVNVISTQIKQAHSLTVLTGAGISAESGIPTFRESQQGLWSRFNPEELATPQAFRQNPRRIMEWYRWRIDLIQGAEPNPGHLALVTLEEYCQNQQKEFCLLTQNVDNLHSRAGSTQVIELHGNIHRLKCFQCGQPSSFNLATWNPEEQLPSCSKCGELLRPDVVWFGENLSNAVVTRAFQAARTSDLFFAIGTSALVQPAAALPAEALEVGAVLVEINPHQTALSRRADYQLPFPAEEILPSLVHQLRE